MITVLNKCPILQIFITRENQLYFSFQTPLSSKINIQIGVYIIKYLSCDIIRSISQCTPELPEKIPLMHCMFPTALFPNHRVVHCEKRQCLNNIFPQEVSCMFRRKFYKIFALSALELPQSQDNIRFLKYLPTIFI